MVYANDLIKILADADVVMFADDTVITVYGKYLDELIFRINRLAYLLFDWANFNRITINKEKTKFMVFTNRNYDDFRVYVDNVSIDKVNSFCYLGINIDDKLKYTSHLTSLNGKLAKLSGISYKLGPKFDLHAARLFYYSFIYSILSYGIVVWGGIIMEYNCDQTHRLIRRILKNLFQRFFPDQDINNVYRNLKLLKLKDIYKFNLVQLYYNMKNNNVLPQVNSDFQQNIINYNIRNPEELNVTFPRTNAVLISYKYQIANMWNQIPEIIKNAPSSDIFKSKLKKHMLSLYT